MSKNTKLLLMIIGFIGLVGFYGIYFGALHHKKGIHLKNSFKIDGTVLKIGQKMPDFSLTDNTGKPFTKKNLEGHWTLLFFGFTNCGFVCPTTMAALGNTYLQLEKKLSKAQLPQVVMISVDPKRDSVARMNEYVKSFNPHFIGARGPLKALLPLEKSLHVVAVKLEATRGTASHYTINHSSEIIVVDPHAEVVAYFAYPHHADNMARDYINLRSQVS